MRARRLVLALSALCGLACASARAGPGDLVQLMDDLVRQGDEMPQNAIDSINELAAKDIAASPLLHRTAITSIGIVEARNGQNTEALGQVAALMALRQTAPLAEADAHLVRAEIEATGGHGEVSYQQARAALSVYGEACAPGARKNPDCDYRAWWRALDLAQHGAAGEGNSVVASAYALATTELPSPAAPCCARSSARHQAR